MRKDFDSQSWHVINPTIGLRVTTAIISTTDSFLGSRNTRNPSDLRNVLPTEAAGRLSRCQRDARKCRDTVDFIISFVRLNIYCGLSQSDCGDVIDLSVKREKQI